MTHKNAELRAVQEKLNRLQTRFDTETERLSREQKERLEKERADLEASIVECKKSALLLEDNVSALVVQRQELNKELSKADTLLQEATERLRNIESLCTTRASEISALEKQAGNLTAEKLKLTHDIEDARDQEQILRNDIDLLQDVLTQTQQKVELSNKEYNDGINDKRKLLKILENKILENNQILEQRHVDEVSLRNELADKERLLNERDQLLRVREAKVEIGENKILRNSNLLNL